MNSGIYQFIEIFNYFHELPQDKFSFDKHIKKYIRTNNIELIQI